MSYNDIIPPDVSGLDAFAVTQFIPSTAELQQTMTGGGAAAGAIVIGLGLERFLQNNVPMIPRAAYPVVHITAGAIAGKFLSTLNPAIGVGWALGMASLGFVRFLQTWLNMDVSLSGIFGGADLSDLADLMDADDLLPPELQDLVIEDSAMGSSDGSDMNGQWLGAVAVETDAMGWAHW